MDSLLFFNPYFGDTILATALANKFSNHFDEQVIVASLDAEMSEFARNLGGNGINYSTLGKLVEEGSQVAIPLVKQYQGYTDLAYYYDCNRAEEKRVEDLCEEIVQDACLMSFNKFYILHYSYAFAKLGQIAKNNGIAVYGYCIDELNRLYFSRGNTDLEIPSIWTKEFIGDRLSRLVTGENLNREDFADLGENIRRHGVKLFPTTRSPQTNAENWAVDLQVLARLHKDFKVLWKDTESRPPQTLPLNQNRYGTFETIGEMTAHIKKSEFIICYDSASFHLAWLTGTPAIVKLKGGFNEEWIPRWVKDDPNYFFIPAIQMYEEEYLSYLMRGLKQIGVKVA